MNTPLPKKIGEAVPAVLPVVVEMVDAWGFLHIKPTAALGVELPHMLPPRLLPAFLNIVGAAEIGLAGSVYNIRVEITREATSWGAEVYKLSGEMEGIVWQNIPADAVLSACLDAV